MMISLASGHRDRMGRGAGEARQCVAPIVEGLSSMPKFGHHPARLAAIAAGEKKWYGPECPHHGNVLRHTSSGHCIACNRERSALQAIVKSRQRSRYVKLADRPERLAAVARGDLIYWGPLCLNGHAGKRRNQSPRYTSSARCVACAQARKGGAAGRTVDVPAATSPTVGQARIVEPSDRRKPEPRTGVAGSRAAQTLLRTARRLRGLISKAR
jgi:hypothetical protein